MELLSPAGDRASLTAAVQNGADAVYFGARGFNARRSAGNFEGDGLREAVEYCHLRGVKVYITLNTMVRQDELNALEDTIGEIYLSGADAFIVQDLGVAEAARRAAPQMELHASTQMAVHNRQGVTRLAQLGFARAVLAREMEFDEIAECAGLGVELETFAHGALCVSCSGQCLMSSIIGGRSGNRGMCAQPCRMMYSLNGTEGYLLSTRDLMTVEMLDRYKDTGVHSLKIEGRLKRPEYVAVVTSIYRRALDGDKITQNDISSLRQIFNRGGFTRGYAPGAEESTLMYRERPNNAGVSVGVSDRRGQVSLFEDIDPADSLVLRGSGEDIPVKLSGIRGAEVSCAKAIKGMRLVRLVSEKQLEAARGTWAQENRPVTLDGKLTLKVGAPAFMSVTDGTHTANALGDIVARAEKRPMDISRAVSQVEKTGGTVYVFRNIDTDIDSDAFVPVSVLNSLRRDALDEMTKMLCQNDRVRGSIGTADYSASKDAKPCLRAQSGKISDLVTAMQNGADDIVFAPLDMRILDDALALDRFYLAVPQVMRAEELDRINTWANAHADKIQGVYLSNLSHFAFAWPGRIIADYPMNIANNITIAQIGADEYSPSVELTSRQISLLGGEKDLIVHGSIPLMQLRHCPGRAAGDVPGKHRDCRMCDKNGRTSLGALTDRTGASFALRRIAYDSGCVIQLMNSVPMMLLRRLDRLPKAGAWRMLIDGDADVVKLYRAALDEQDFTKLPQWKKYDEMRSTTGHYFRGVE